MADRADKPKREPRRYQTKPVGSGLGPQAKTRELLPQYAALFAERDSDGARLTLAEIGRRMGRTRENVRQIRKKYFAGLESVRVKSKARTMARKAEERTAKMRASLWMFHLTVQRLLMAEGYRQCGVCLRVKCMKDFTNGQMHRCKRCTANATEAYNATQSGKEKQDEWRAANPDRLREYSRRLRHKGITPPPQPCPRCGLLVCGNPKNRSIPLGHKRPDGEWCSAAIAELPA